MGFLTENAALSWLCLVVLLSFLELFFCRYRLLWVSVGCAGGLFVSLFRGPYWVQVGVAVVLSAGLLWFTRNWVRQVRCEDALHEILPTEVNNNERIPPINTIRENEREIFQERMEENDKEEDSEIKENESVAIKPSHLSSFDF